MIFCDFKLSNKKRNFVIVKYSRLHSVTSVILAVLVLFSTLSLTIEKHFCGDTLIDVAIFNTVEKCTSKSCAVDVDSISKPSCCKDEVEVIQGQSQLSLDKTEYLDIKSQKFLIAVVAYYSKRFENSTKQKIPHRQYLPPILIKDIQLLDEVFLI